MTEKELRLSKLKEWEEFQTLYPEKFEKTNNCSECKEFMDNLSDIKIAGRIMLKREIGGIIFINLQDYSGNFQIVLKKEELIHYDFYAKNLDLGDIIGTAGEIFTTKKGEKSLLVKQLTLLSKCFHSLPEKWHGLQDEETKMRKRYLDLLINEESKNRFKTRHKIIQKIKDFLNEANFIEVETPILQTIASGALATPFQTHHKALDIPLFLRIAPETYLKRLIAGGYERIYELGKSFRNEGIDSTHLQEFTMLEFYCAYWNYENAIEFVENLFKYLFKELSLPSILKFQDKDVDFSFNWKKITYRDLFLEYTNLDLNELLKDETNLSAALSNFIDVKEYKSAASMIDAVYKKHCRPKLINPTVIFNQPAVLGPLARVSDKNSLFSDRFQIVIDGLEVVNAYSELVDPIKQREVLLNQMELQKNGEEEAMILEEDFLLAMEHAMPPIAGVGIGIDRIVAILTNAKTLREVVFFPNLKNKE